MNAKAIKMSTKILISTLCILYFMSCNNSTGIEENSLKSTNDIAEEYENTITLPFNSNFDTTQTKNHLKIIKSANVKYKVENVKEVTAHIKKIAHRYSAYISNLRLENNQFTLENSFTVKIPYRYFDIMMDSIGKTAEFIEYENISTEDVTADFIDIQARLKTKKEVKTRYELVLKQNAKTVKDILDTEEKLQIIQEEIEAAQGKLKYLRDKVKYSTIHITLYETVNYEEELDRYEKSFWSKLKEAILFGWNLIQSIILGLFYLWPILLIGFFIFILLRKKLSKKH